MNTSDWVIPVTIILGTLALIYICIIVLIALLRRGLWLLSKPFFLIDEFMWFLYNPLRFAMRNQEARSNRIGYYLFTILFLKPVWQVGIWILTTPLRVVTALYFDVLVYLFVMMSDAVDELLHPKLGKMRHRKGKDYWFRWITGLPFRAGWLLYKNALAVLDSMLMFVTSVAWPTFTMYHGTAPDAVYDIAGRGRWLVGSGNYGGSGIYFGRSPRVAVHYSRSASRGAGEAHVIIARVTLSMLRNCGTLREHHRSNVGRMGASGVDLAKSIKFPYFATELWRKDKDWWEYCILRGDQAGQFVSSWRIRPIGFVKTSGDHILGGALERLWGGHSHYALRFSNWLLAMFLSAGLFLFLFVIWSYLYFNAV